MAGLIGSLTPSEQVQLIYVSNLDRAADAGGSIYWDGIYNQLTTGGGGQSSFQALATISNDFLSSAAVVYPFLGTQGPLNASDPATVSACTSFLQSVYLNLFNLTPAASDPGIQYWSNLILTNAIPLSSAILYIANSASGPGLTTLENKITAGAYFTTQTAGANLGLTSATTTAPLLNAATGSIAGITSDPATVTASETATNTFIASGAGEAGNVINIVAGTFVYNGTPGNDIFIADNTQGPGKYNLTALDQISGGGGVDTLKDYSDGTPGGIAFTPSQITGLSTLWVNNIGAAPLDVTGITGLKTVQLDTPKGFATVKLNGQALTISNDTAVPHVITINSTVDTTENVTLFSVGAKGAPDLIDIAGTLVTSATLTGAGAATDYVTINNAVGAHLATLHIGNGPSLAVTTDVSDVALKTVDASAEAAGTTLSVDLTGLPAAVAGLAFTGGAGATTLTLSQVELDALTSGSQLNGGSATSGNELDLTNVANFAAADYTVLNATTGFQALGFNSLTANTNVNGSTLTAFTQFVDSDVSANTLALNQLASGDTVTLLAGNAGLTVGAAAGGSTETLNVGNSTSMGIGEVVTLNNIGTLDLSSNGSATGSPQNFLFFNNTGGTNYVITGSTNLDIGSVGGGTNSKTVTATGFNGQLAIGNDATHAGFVGYVGGDNLNPGTSGAGDVINLGSGASIVVEQANESLASPVAPGIPDNITLAATHAASTIAYAGGDLVYVAAAPLEKVSAFTLGQDSIGINNFANVVGTAANTGSGLTITKGLVTGGAATAAAFEAAIAAATPTVAGATVVYTDGSNSYVAESTGAAAGDFHVVELVGVHAATGVTIANGLAVIA